MSYRNGERKGFGVVSEDGEHIYTFDFSKKIAHLQWMSDDEFQKYLER